MKQKLAILIGAIFFLQTLAGQENMVDPTDRLPVSVPVKVKLTGKITDSKTGEALAGAYIYFTDDKIGTSSDEKGQYVLTNIPPGHHVVEVSFTGYSTLVEHIEINADMQKDFALSTRIVENQGVVITGVSGATSIRKAPVPITSIKKATLLQTPSGNIIDALSHVPGISQVSTGPAISKPIIRGLGANRVVTVNDGIRQEGQQWGMNTGLRSMK